jgi:hypothetical protein
MKLWKKILLILLAAFVLLQLPFVYRRFRIAQLAEKIDQLNSQRSASNNPRFKDYKGIIHAHTSLGGHSTGSFDELIAAANADDLDFAVMTEHYTDLYDTSALTLNGIYGKTLFVGGNEIDTADGDRFLMIPGSAEAAGMRKLPTNAVLEKLHAENSLALITYPEKFKSWDSNFDGDEIFSLHTQLKEANPFSLFFDLIWSYPAYPDLMLATHFHRPDANLRKFDEVAAKRHITMSVATDAHSNIGFHILGDDTGNKLLNLKLDPYQTVFRIASVHVLLPSNEILSRETLIQALKSGNSYIAFDTIGDPKGFGFWASHGLVGKQMGDELAVIDGSVAKMVSPIPARFVLFRDGQRYFEEANIKEATVPLKDPGAYRVELYLDQLGSPFDRVPWILSNPIYVR